MNYGYLVKVIVYQENYQSIPSYPMALTSVSFDILPCQKANDGAMRGEILPLDNDQ